MSLPTICNGPVVAPPRTGRVPYLSLVAGEAILRADSMGSNVYIPCTVLLIEVDVRKAGKVIQTSQCKRENRLAFTSDAKGRIGDIRFGRSNVTLLEDLAAQCRINRLGLDDKVSDTV